MAKSGKGSAFERQMSKYISKWILNDPNAEPIIWRSSNSGGTFTTNRLRGNSRQAAMASDLISIDERSKWFMEFFSIECKNGYKGASIFSTFKNSKSDILKGFWEQASRDADLSNRVPMLIFKPLGNSELIGLPLPVVSKYFCEMLTADQMVQVTFNKQLSTLCLFKLKEFFERYTAEEIKIKIPN